jgi:hypothetical protein
MSLQKVEEHLEQALEYLSAALAQLAFLSSVRDNCTGRYLHEGWYHCASPEEVHRVLQGAHREVFGRVLDLPLAELCQELTRYFCAESGGGTEQAAAQVWLELEPYREMIPQGCSPLDRELFLSQLRSALGVLVTRRESPPLGEQGASPHPPLDPRSQHRWDN